ncbi:uncharacterized protein [Rutidosis leptorrhynchoides]|uniref:uncharacterized protein n=1 Tax=Rutidosis leptorrhynchoides TaxID=125765 RepID=UPI003A998691
MNLQGVDWVIGGDFNEHYQFTRINDDGVKFSKLDRFLVSEGFLHTWGDISTIALERKTLDHYPLVLRDKNNDFGPKPFRIFDIWLENKEVELVITTAWNKKVVGNRPDCVFRNRLKNVKEALRVWSKKKYGTIDEEIDSWKKKADEYESKANLGPLTEEDRVEWMSVRNKWFQKENEKTEMLRQKARLKWIAEGDDNTSYFHASIKRRNLMIVHYTFLVICKLEE